jgi:hypothetical protein
MTWEQTRRDFCRIAAQMGVAKVADEIPAGRDTVYRLIRGTTEQPTRAVKAGIERIVKEHTNGHDH